MGKKFISILAVIVLAVCLISGGCFSPAENEDVKAWKDLLRLSPETEETGESEIVESKPEEEVATIKESTDIKLYFAGPNGANLVLEKRAVEKTEGIARKTMEELIDGPRTPENLAVFPEGTELLDINIKPDGLCIVDLSPDVRQIDNANQEKIMIYAMVNTLGQFSTVENVSFMVNGEQVNYIAGFMDVSAPVSPDYSLQD